jgi:hypothetical protein
MKRILGILAGLMLACAAQAANFTAAAPGDWHTTNTWGVTSIPGASDNVSLNAKAVTMTGTVTCASLIKGGTGGSLTFGTNASFTCRAVTNAPLMTSAPGVVVDCDYKLTTGRGLNINAGGAVTIAGTWSNSGSLQGVYNVGGTVTAFTGTLNNSGSGSGAYNSGTWTDFTGTLNNSGDGNGAYNGGTWSDFTGTLNNSGDSYGYGVYNDGGTWTDFSGTLTNSGNGYGVYNDGGSIWTDFSGTLNNSGDGNGAYNGGSTWTDFSGTLTNSGNGYGVVNAGSTWTDFSGNLVLSSANVEAIAGDAIPFSGSIKIAVQSDLAAENIVVGKTILGVTGTKATGGGINGTGLLGASW